MCLVPSPPVLGRRLHVLLDDDRFDRLQRLALERGVSIGSLVRRAVDVAFPADGERRSAAAAAILDAGAAPSPKLDDLRTELADLRSAGTTDPAAGPEQRAPRRTRRTGG